MFLMYKIAILYIRNALAQDRAGQSEESELLEGGPVGAPPHDRS